MNDTPNLALPYILAAQAQKHVTHNEAIRALDCLVQLSVASRTLSVSPASPGDGSRYIVASGASGDWAGQDGKVAAYQDGAWAFYAPRTGWRAWIEDDGKLRVWNGSDWAVAASGSGDGGGGLEAPVANADLANMAAGTIKGNNTGGSAKPKNLTATEATAMLDVAVGSGAAHAKGLVPDPGGSAGMAKFLREDMSWAEPPSGGGGDIEWPTFYDDLEHIGINATADSSNVLAIKGPASLFDNGGTGHQQKINKKTAGDTASVVYQTNYSGRAEMGLAGDDDFHFKVSPNGSTWYEALRINRNSGRVSFPIMGGPREVLTANRTYYVRTDGSDSNTGLANTSGGAFLTVQGALNVCATIDFNGFTVTISVGAGTFSERPSAPVMVGQAGIANLVINGAGNTTIISGSSAYDGIVNARGIGALLTISNLRIVNADTNGYCVYAVAGGQIKIGSGIELAAGSSGYCVCAQRAGVVAIASTTITITANCGGLWRAFDAGILALYQVVAACGTRAFASATALIGTLGFLEHNGTTYTGTITGKRYDAQTNAVIQTYGSGASAIAGSTAGTTATGGQYV